jgi:hypothetical protein
MRELLAWDGQDARVIAARIARSARPVKWSPKARNYPPSPIGVPGRVTALWGMMEVRGSDLSKNMWRTETYLCPLQARDQTIGGAH